jgi:hypothetical protein
MKQKLNGDPLKFFSTLPGGIGVPLYHLSFDSNQGLLIEVVDVFVETRYQRHLYVRGVGSRPIGASPESPTFPMSSSDSRISMKAQEERRSHWSCISALRLCISFRFAGRVESMNSVLLLLSRLYYLTYLEAFSLRRFLAF